MAGVEGSNRQSMMLRPMSASPLARVVLRSRVHEPMHKQRCALLCPTGPIEVTRARATQRAGAGTTILQACAPWRCA
eukprot:10560760-Alexandrium_andersonii.AAC.1